MLLGNTRETVFNQRSEFRKKNSLTKVQTRLEFGDNYANLWSSVGVLDHFHGCFPGVSRVFPGHSKAQFSLSLFYFVKNPHSFC